MCFVLPFIRREVRDNHTLLPHFLFPFLLTFGPSAVLGAAYGARCPAVTRQVSQSGWDNMSHPIKRIGATRFSRWVRNWSGRQQSERW
jgi:hypothetical protein